MSISYKWTSACIRKCFIDFFVKNHQHKLVPSSSVISSDPSLLFNNAGMNQFKDIFIGNISPNHPYYELRRAVSSQKCIRTGGKHNDLDVVGYDLTHHTFFEMLGNWSFNSYFKKEACTMAFELITKVYKLPLDKLIITYFAGDKTLSLPADEETKEIWLSLGFPQNRILPTNENFWEMGESGPCGVCSEIYFQLDPSTFSLEKCVEIWNIVFIQYYKDESGIVTKLPANHVDTGMGLERMASILNNVPSSYDTDLFQPLLTTISTMTKSRPYQGSLKDNLDIAYRVVADHSRMITISLSDDLKPGTKDTGRHFRQIFRKTFAHLIFDFGYKEPEKVLIELSKKVGNNLGDVYPEINLKMDRNLSVIAQESILATDIIEKATKLFNKIANQLENNKQDCISGDAVFDLFLNGGASIFMINRMAGNRNLKVDWEGFEKCFAKHKAKSAEGLEESRKKSKNNQTQLNVNK